MAVGFLEVLLLYPESRFFEIKKWEGFSERSIGKPACVLNTSDFGNQSPQAKRHKQEITVCASTDMYGQTDY